MRGRVAAPATFAHHDRREVEVERLADARLDAAIGGAAADDDDVAPQHVQELGDACPIEGAGPALEEDVILGPRRDLVGEAGFCRALDSVGERRHAGLRRKIGRQHDDVGTIGAAHWCRVDHRHTHRPRNPHHLHPGIEHGAHGCPPRGIRRS